MHEIAIALILGIAAGVFFMWWNHRAQKRKQARLDQEMRDTALAEREKQLQAAKDKGDLDRWRNKN